jgi:hypothetical protein
MRGAVAILSVLAAAGCLPVGAGGDAAPAALPTPPAPGAAAETGDPALLPVVVEAGPAGEMLGRVIVSPGNAAEPGLWLRTSRTPRAAQGTVVSATGVAVDVMLIHAAGVSQMSAAAYAALGLPPGSFAEVTIFLR